MTQIRLALMLYFFMVAHKAHFSCIPNPVDILLELFEDLVEVLVVLEIFLIEDSYVEDLCGAPSCSETCLFFSDDLLRVWLQSVFSYDLQYVFAWEADRRVVLALLQVAFHGKCDD